MNNSLMYQFFLYKSSTASNSFSTCLSQEYFFMAFDAFSPIVCAASWSKYAFPFDLVSHQSKPRPNHQHNCKDEMI